MSERGEPGGLFEQIFVPDALLQAVGDRAWLQAMLDAEAALAAAQAAAGMISARDAEAIRSVCDASLFDPAALGREGRAAGNPVVPLVKALTDAVPGEAARHVHRGATSQDIIDTAAMLVAARSLDLILTDLDALAAACAHLAKAHRHTPMPGRTLMQQALPTTFGLKAAEWLVAVVESRASLACIRQNRLAAQLGGAVGTLASLGEAGPAVVSGFARELDLAEPVLPWHASRGRIADLGGALSACAGVTEKLAGDVILLSQTEVGEAAEPAGEGRGGSSTLPHKRNPILSTTAVASARRTRSASQTLQAAMDHEHERAAGAWHSEWLALSDALAATGRAVAAMREVAEGLEVHPERMRRNLDATGGLIMAEHITTILSGEMDRLRAHELVQGACRRVTRDGTALRDELLAEDAIREAITEDELDAALDPAGYLGSASEFVDRALRFYEEAQA